VLIDTKTSPRAKLVVCPQGLSSLPKHGSMPNYGSMIGGSHAIGSLPKGLTAEDRKAIIQATPMSPSLSLLSSLGPVRTPGHWLHEFPECAGLSVSVSQKIHDSLTPAAAVPP
jgi:hypothetical protein